jgi:hypothetical protein
MTSTCRAIHPSIRLSATITTTTSPGKGPCPSGTTTCWPCPSGSGCSVLRAKGPSGTGGPTWRTTTCCKSPGTTSGRPPRSHRTGRSGTATIPAKFRRQERARCTSAFTTRDGLDEAPFRPNFFEHFFCFYLKKYFK